MTYGVMRSAISLANQLANTRFANYPAQSDLDQIYAIVIANRLLIS